MKIDDLPDSMRNILLRISGAMDLPEITEFETAEHLLFEVLHRVSQARCLAEQTVKNLSGKPRGYRQEAK